MTTSSIDWPCPALADAALAPRTTLKVGGRVAWLLEPRHPDELVAALRVAREEGLAPRILGGGANLIVEDGLHPGVVVATERLARVFRPAPSEEQHGEHSARASDEVPFAPELAHPHDDPRLIPWAGAGLPGLVRAARDLGLTGLEGLVGVPGQLGGGVAMNAGGRWGELWDVIESVRLFTAEGELVERTRAECSPGYRDGNLEGAVVIGAVLRLAPGEKPAIQAAMKQYLSEKSAAQPVTERSCGCIFKNPDPEESDGRGAGKLVEDCGGKGLTEGDIVVSPKHGNFFVNQGGGTATDVLRLIDRVQALVLERTGVELAREVQIWRRAPAG